MEKKATERMIHWDLLRILACFSVIMLHSASQNWYDLPVTSSTWLVFNSYDAISRYGVPVFVMLSGCLFLSKPDKLSVKYLYLHNIARLVIAYVFWSSLYGLWDSRGFQGVGIKSYIIEMISGRYHLWYLPMLIGIYMLLPVLKLFSEEKNKKILEYVLILFFILQISRETILAFQFSDHIKDVIRLLDVEMVCSYIGYFLLGYYLQRYPLSEKKQKKIYLAGILGAVSAIVIDNFISVHRGEATAAFYDSWSLPTFCVSVALFVFFQQKISRIHWSKSGTSIILHLSGNTFGVYLIHLLVLEILKLNGIDTMMFSGIISVPVIALLCFIISNLIISCIHHIPVIGKYIC